MDDKFIGNQLIKNMTVEINGSCIQNFSYGKNGELVANVKHENGNKEDCYFCNLHSEMAVERPSDFEYYYGTKHIYLPEKETWEGYIGYQCVDSYSKEYYQIMKEFYKVK